MKKNEVKITTLLGKGSEINGDFKCPGSARIDGVVLGDVEVEGTLILGSFGKIEGTVSAKCAIISGEVSNNITAPERVELVAGSKVIGDITTALIVIDEHAIFQGKCDMNQATPNKRARNKVAKAGYKSARDALQVALNEVDEVPAAVPVNTEENVEEGL